jgi:hypothetical protein
VHRREGVFDMIRMENRNHSSLTTRDHSWLVQSKLTNGTRPWRFKTSEKLSIIDAIPSAAPCVTLPTEVKYTDAFVETVAWYATEGCRHSGGGITISQSEVVYPENCTRIRAALEVLDPGRWREFYKKPMQAEVARSFWLRKDVADQVKAVAPGKQKVITYDFILSLTKAQLQLFIDVYRLGDGYGPGRGIAQKHKACLEPMQMAYALLGVRTNLYQRKDGQWILGTNTRPLANPVRAARTQDNSFIKEIKYEGTVWCPTTPNSTWLARRNGHTYYTGNCAFRQPCLGKFAGEDYQYTLQTLFRQEEPYYYRQERGPSTESKGGE